MSGACFLALQNLALKAVLLHKGNNFPSVLLTHTANRKDSYENMKLLLEKFQYEKYNRNVRKFCKVIAVLLGYTKFCYFLCDWDSRGRKKHYIQNQ
jgi:hypothetical protein